MRHPSQKLWLFQFARSFRNQFRSSWYIMVWNQTFETKVMAVWICQELSCSISRILIYYGLHWGIRVKRYGILNLVGAFVFNFKFLDIIWSTIRHPIKNLWQFEFARSFSNQFRIKYSSQKLWQFEFDRNFRVQFRGSRYIMVCNQTSESKVIRFWICQELPCSISNVSIYYCLQSDIWVKSHCSLILLRVFVSNFERLNKLRSIIRYPTQRLWYFEFGQRFRDQFLASWCIMVRNQTFESKVTLVSIR